MHLSKLFFTDLGPFDEIEFEFDEHVNVFTGPNNSGKSTVLLTLGEIAVYPFALPEKLLRASAPKFRVELSTGRKVFKGTIPIDIDEFDDFVKLMTQIGYSSFVPAIRLSTDFRAKVPTVPKPSDDEEHYKHFEELWKRTRLIHTNPSSISDEAVVQKIIELDYRAYRRDSPTVRNIIDKTVTIASEITESYPLRFERVDEDEDGLYPQFDTPDGLMPLNVLSQGTQSLVQWLAHLLIGMAEYYDYPEDIEKENGILIIDEIDAHLHPSWQRRIIPALTNHFPNLQMFCSTHSPLMLAGLKTGQVQLLDRDENGKVTVSRNEQDIVGWSADEIMRSFLDVPNPTDLETVQNIERLQELRQIDGLTDEQTSELNRLRETVRRDLIGGPLATELDELRSILNESKRNSSPDSPSQ
ncbi:MAG: AAA family ATPase [Dehalococcoidia bacterium]|nr:AAA family ATPase [Dehalococcoidia bacterium]